MSTITGDEDVTVPAEGVTDQDDGNYAVLEKWQSATQRKQITLVTAGRSGVGKSTLIGS